MEIKKVLPEPKKIQSSGIFLKTISHESDHSDGHEKSINECYYEKRSNIDYIRTEIDVAGVICSSHGSL